MGPSLFDIQGDLCKQEVECLIRNEKKEYNPKIPLKTRSIKKICFVPAQLCDETFFYL